MGEDKRLLFRYLKVGDDLLEVEGESIVNG